MDELMVKALRGDASDFELRQLERWRGEGPENEKEFQEVSRLWARTSELLEQSVPPPPALSEILAHGDRLRRRAWGQSRARRILRSPVFGFGLAAAAVAALSLPGLRLSPDPADLTGAVLSPVETSSGTGDITTLSLSDGSVVRLASESRIEFPPGGRERNVVLEGRAFFAIAAGDAPFVVRTRLGEVTVRGTRFEVRVEGEDLRVAVLEGLVDVEGGESRLRVGPGQVAYLPSGGAPRVEDGGDLGSLLAWPGGLLIFQETPLLEVVGEVAAHFGVDFELRDPGLETRRITAWFGDEPLDEVVSALCLVAGAQCRVDGDRILVDR